MVFESLYTDTSKKVPLVYRPTTMFLKMEVGCKNDVEIVKSFLNRHRFNYVEKTVKFTVKNKLNWIPTLFDDSMTFNSIVILDLKELVKSNHSVLVTVTVK